MNDQTRNELVAQLAEVKDRLSELQSTIKAHAANLPEIRKNLGNPFFYSGKPEGDPESRSRFTGYASHEPGLERIREAQELSKQIDKIEVQLRGSKLDSD